MINILKSTFLMTLLVVLLGGLGYLIGGHDMAIVFLLISIAFNFVSFWFSDRIVLASYQAQEVGPDQAPRLYDMVERISMQAGIPMPRVYIMPSSSPNAFATGRSPKHAVVAVTQGLLRVMDEEEVEGVLAHEIAHVKHRDILTGTIVASVVGAISFIAMMARFAAIFGGMGGRSRNGGNPLALLAMAILAPIIAVIIQLAISRSREFHADRGSAKILGSPRPLMRALQKLDMAHRNEQHVMARSQANPATAHMFIVNPLRGGGLSKLFSTHPAIEDRIERLRKLA